MAFLKLTVQLAFLAPVLILFSVTGQTSIESSSSSSEEEESASPHKAGHSHHQTINITSSGPDSVYQGVICGGVSSKLHCPSGRSIMIESATYGRQEALTCSEHIRVLEVEHSTSCRLDVATVLNNRCKNKEHCVVHVSTPLMGGDPCPLTNKYLSFTAKCV